VSQDSSGEGVPNAEEHETQLHTSQHFREELQKLIQGRTTDLSVDERDAVQALPSGAALLVVRRGPDSGARFLLDQDSTIAGRHPGVDIFLDDVTVSRKHAEFMRRGTSFFVKDLNSLNGTFMQGERIEGEIPLEDGMEVQVGKFKLTFFASAHDLAGEEF
jgi:pSer/pThr/pTyr-binding forkhead associated (FHA) protein